MKTTSPDPQLEAVLSQFPESDQPFAAATMEHCRIVFLVNKAADPHKVAASGEVAFFGSLFAAVQTAMSRVKAGEDPERFVRTIHQLGRDLAGWAQQAETPEGNVIPVARFARARRRVAERRRTLAALRGADE